MDSIEQKKYYRLGSNTLSLFVIQDVSLSFIFFIMAIGLVFFKDYFSGADFLPIIDSVTSACFLLWVISLAIGGFVAIIQYKTCSIMMDDSSFHLVRGILSKEEVAIPYRWIQSVEIEQSLFLRIMGVARVIVTTINSLEQPDQQKDKMSDKIVSLMDHQLAKLVAGELAGKAEVEKMQMQK